jgi:NAD(P)-dependent dehydrogenase (short-subunit alcohol dehydrogenase family)
LLGARLSVLGAGGGLGYEIAIALTREGAKVALEKRRGLLRLGVAYVARLESQLRPAPAVERPELTKRPFFTHKRTYQERYAALGKASACVRSGLNPSIFSDGMCSTPET